MRRPLLIALLLTLPLLGLRAQTDVPAADLPTGTIDMGGGFLIDMGLMDIAPTTVDDYHLQLPDLQLRDFNRLFRLPNTAIYGRGTMPRMGSASILGLGLWDATDNVQMGTFRLPGGATLHTYGDYDASGRRVYNPARLPWERDTFRGAFELKSRGGHFGVRVEFRRGY